MELSIPQLEFLLQGCNENNEDIENQTKGKKKALEGADAIQYLIDNEM
jgi:hypothetical protein